MVSRGELFAGITSLLKASGVEDYRFDAQCIMEDCLNLSLPSILMDGNKIVPDDTAEEILTMTKKRSKGVPLQYILGQWEFFGYPFKVGEGVLIPRPDTETLIEQILGICREKGISSPKIADLCSGTGCIAITLKKELPDAEVFAVELSEKALGYLQANKILNNADIRIIHGDALSEEVASSLTELDIIVSNPPYLTAEEMNELQPEVRHEPSLALFGGNDGLGFYRKITSLWRNSLRENGFIAYEFGINQHDAVREILENNGFGNITLRSDLGGIIRTAAARKLTEVS